MYLADNEKFGKLISELRKEKNFTQKELAEQLFVSDKTVSKWERGASMPNIALLIPIADLFDITVTELLKGERSTDGHLTEAPSDISIQNVLKRHKRNWRILYFICLIITLAEIFLLTRSGLSLSEMKNDVLCVCFLMLLFSGWLCFFAKDLLPGYYDSNRINYVTQGIFRVHLAGLSFCNSNWPCLCTVFKSCALAVSVLYPLLCLAVLTSIGKDLWNEIKNIASAVSLIVMIIPIYYAGKKYE